MISKAKATHACTKSIDTAVTKVLFGTIALVFPTLDLTVVSVGRTAVVFIFRFSSGSPYSRPDVVSVSRVAGYIRD